MIHRKQQSTVTQKEWHVAFIALCLAILCSGIGLASAEYGSAGCSGGLDQDCDGRLRPVGVPVTIGEWFYRDYDLDDRDPMVGSANDQYGGW